MIKEEMLKEMGVALDDMIDTAMLLWVPHPGVETEARAREVFSSELRRALADPNVWVLLYAGVALERDARQGRIPNLDPVSYEKDLTCLIADEVLGMAISMYVGGTRDTSIMPDSTSSNLEFSNRSGHSWMISSPA